MRSYVFTDQGLTKHAGRFVWLSIDTEKAQNAPFLIAYPIESWPTLLVIDPASPEEGATAFKWLGSATVAQLERLLDDGEQAVRGKKTQDHADQALAEADRLYAARKPAEAAIAYRRALDAAPATWARRSRAVESMIIAHDGAHQSQACAQAAEQEAPKLARGPSFANATYLGLSCALGEPEQTPWRPAALRALEPLAQEAVALPGILADDRSGLFELLVEARANAQDTEGKQRVALQWITFLETEAAKARTPEERAAFDPHRVSAALAAKDPARAIPPLTQSEKDLPHDYNAPARLALLYRELGRYDDALADIDRALAKVYGPRKLRLLETKAGIFKLKGDLKSSATTLETAVAEAERLPEGQRSEKTIARLKAELSKLK